MALPREEVQHIALLARLELTPAEEESLSTQLGAILEYIQLLQEVDTTDVAPTATVVDTENPMREDRVTNAPQVDAMLANAPARDASHFKVPKIIE